MIIYPHVHVSFFHISISCFDCWDNWLALLFKAPLEFSHTPFVFYISLVASGVTSPICFPAITTIANASLLQLHLIFPAHPLMIHFSLPLFGIFGRTIRPWNTSSRPLSLLSFAHLPQFLVCEGRISGPPPSPTVCCIGNNTQPNVMEIVWLSLVMLRRFYLQSGVDGWYCKNSGFGAM